MINVISQIENDSIKIIEQEGKYKALVGAKTVTLEMDEDFLTTAKEYDVSSSNYIVDKKCYGISYANNHEIAIYNSKMNRGFTRIAEYEIMGNGYKFKISKSSDLFDIWCVCNTKLSSVFVNRIRRSIVDYAYSNTVNVKDECPGYLTIKYIPESGASKIDYSEFIRHCEDILCEIAIKTNRPYEFHKRTNFVGIKASDDQRLFKLDAPKIQYNLKMGRYYRVALAASMPSMSFLHYYQVVEANFTATCDEKLLGLIKGKICDPKFSPTTDRIHEIVRLSVKYSENIDETESLKLVLERFIDIDELKKYIVDNDKDEERHRFMKRRTIFGKEIHLNPESDGFLSCLANAIKTIRNAIVHANDRYDGNERYYPYSDADQLIFDYLGLMRFISEKILIGSGQVRE